MKPVRYVSAAVMGALIAVLVWASRGWFAGAGISLVMMRLCDGFFVAAVILMGLGALCFVGNEGFFDVAGYGFVSVMRIFHLDPKKIKNKESFPEYRARKHAKQADVKFLLIVGGAYLALSGICYAGFYLL